MSETDIAPMPVEQLISCPFCAESIQPAARKCKHCGEWLDAPSSVGHSEGDTKAGGSFVFGAQAPPSARYSLVQVVGAGVLGLVLLVGGISIMRSGSDGSSSTGVAPPVEAQMTLAEYAIGAQQSCDTMFASLDALVEPGTISAMGVDHEARADAYQTLVISLRGMDTPAEDRVTIESWISAIEELVGIEEVAAHAAYSQDLDAFTAAVGDLSSQLAIARTRGSSLGVNCP